MILALAVLAIVASVTALMLSNLAAGIAFLGAGGALSIIRMWQARQHQWRREWSRQPPEKPMPD